MIVIDIEQRLDEVVWNVRIEAISLSTLDAELKHLFVTAAPSRTDRPHQVAIGLWPIHLGRDRSIKPKPLRLARRCVSTHRNRDHGGGRFGACWIKFVCLDQIRLRLFEVFFESRPTFFRHRVGIAFPALTPAGSDVVQTKGGVQCARVYTADHLKPIRKRGGDIGRQVIVQL